MKKINYNLGFTLAEIIVSMTIIGVIAAITIPALLVSTSTKTMEAQKKALMTRMAQSISQIEDLRVYGRSNDDGDKSSALNFINKALRKVYKVNQTCDYKEITSSCKFPAEVTVPGQTELFKIDNITSLSNYIDNSGTTFSLDTRPAGFITANGESIVLFYNPKCRGAKVNGFYSGSAASAMCLNMIFDLNGSDQAPNEVGKDVGFISVFFPKDPDIVLPMAYSVDVSSSTAISGYETAIKACKKQNSGLIIPNWEEGLVMTLNKRLTGLSDNTTYMVTGAGSTNAYKVNTGDLTTSSVESYTGLKLRCVYNR